MPSKGSDPFCHGLLTRRSWILIRWQNLSDYICPRGRATISELGLTVRPDSPVIHQMIPCVATSAQQELRL